MPFLDYFRNLFSRRQVQEPPQNRFEDDRQHTDSFRNPIWQTEEEEDDVSEFGSRIPRNRFQFRVFSDPFEMTRFFETQMDDMLKNFFRIDGFGNEFGNHSSFFDNFFKGNEFGLPMPDDTPRNTRPRDEVLKPSLDEPNSFHDGFSNLLPLPDTNSDKRYRNEVLKPSYEIPDANSKKQDSDIDGKIESNELAKIWKTPQAEGRVNPFSIRSFGSSVSTQIIRRPDGTVEQRRTVRDSDGNEETSVTRQIGDKTHTVVTKKAKDGSEVKTEDIVNMDENELKGFDEKWSSNRIVLKEPDDNDDRYFPWHKFFGPNPKL